MGSDKEGNICPSTALNQSRTAAVIGTGAGAVQVLMHYMLALAVV